MNTTLETQLQKAMNVVNWDNWTDDETNEPAKLGDVYYCKLDWLKDHLKDDEDLEEMLDIINDLQETIVPILNELDKY